MAQFSVNTHWFDPYKNFKFRIKWMAGMWPAIFEISGGADD